MTRSACSTALCKGARTAGLLPCLRLLASIKQVGDQAAGPAAGPCVLCQPLNRPRRRRRPGSCPDKRGWSRVAVGSGRAGMMPWEAAAAQAAAPGRQGPRRAARPHQTQIRRPHRFSYAKPGAHAVRECDVHERLVQGCFSAAPRFASDPAKQLDRSLLPTVGQQPCGGEPWRALERTKQRSLAGAARRPPSARMTITAALTVTPAAAAARPAAQMRRGSERALRHKARPRATAAPPLPRASCSALRASRTCQSTCGTTSSS